MSWSYQQVKQEIENVGIGRAREIHYEVNDCDRFIFKTLLALHDCLNLFLPTFGPSMAIYTLPLQDLRNGVLNSSMQTVVS